ncbi:MAG: hypothetical protein AAGD33_19465 [Actinomycetota bacterium]
MRVWKWVGLAGIAGVAVTATAVAVNQRETREWHEVDPDEVRAHLYDRLGLDAPPVVAAAGASAPRRAAATSSGRGVRSRMTARLRRIPIPGRSHPTP